MNRYTQDSYRSVSRRDRASSPFLSLMLQLILLSISILSIDLLLGIDDSSTLYNLCWLNNITYIVEMIFLYRAIGTIIHPVFLFDTIVFLFCSGQCVLYSIDITPLGYDVFTRITDETLISSLRFAIPGYIMFCIGSQIAIYKSGSTKKHAGKQDRSIANLIESSNTWGIVLLAIGVVPFIIVLSNSLSVFFTVGYSAYYSDSSARISNTISFFVYYFYAGLFIFASSSKHLSRRISMAVLILIAAFYFLCGDRGTAISLLLALLLVYKGTNPDKSAILPAITLAIISMSSVSVVADWRHSTDASFLSVASSSLVSNNIIVSTMSNLGGTIFSLAKVIELFPTFQSFLFGKTYLASLVLLVPSGLALGPLRAVRSSTLLSSPATWLMNALGMSYGPGFTPFAEAYMNFGTYGVFALGLLGYFFSWIMTFVYFDGSDSLNNSFRSLSFFLFAMAARGSINYVVAFLVRYILIPYFLIRYTGKSKSLHSIRNVSIHDM